MLFLKLKRLFLFFVLLGCISPISVFSQPTHFIPGWVEDQNSYNKLNILSPDGSKDIMPAVVDLSPFCPTPQHQGSIGSCVGWAVGYSALTIQHAIQRKWSKQEIDDNSFSALFLYHHIKRGDCMSGATLEDAGNFLYESGDCKSKDFDDPKDTCERTPSKELLEIASNYKILDHLAVFPTTANSKEKILQTKKSLNDSIPVVIGLNIRQNFQDLSSKFWDTTEGDTTSIGGHALTIVGYNDSYKAFQVVNCWGTDWGDKGFFWLKYEDYAKYCSTAIQYIVGDLEIENTPNYKAPNTNINLKGAFSLGLPYFPDPDSDDYELETVNALYQGNYQYQLEKNDWEIGDQYKLSVTKLLKKRYVYVFSFDNKGINIHYPSSEKFANGVLGSGESPIRTGGRRVNIPQDKYTALERRTTGVDYIFVLFSAKKITDFQKRISQFKKLMGDGKQRFLSSFSDILMPPNQINYTIDQMEFTTKTNNDIFVSPIILAISGS